MKRAILFLCAVSLCVSLLASCKGDGGYPGDSESDTTDISDTTTSQTTAAPITTAEPEETTEGGTTATATAPPTASNNDNTPPASTAPTAPPATTAATTTAPPAPTTATIMVTPGLSIAQIGTLTEKAGVCTRQALIDTANSYDFSYYPLVAAIPAGGNRGIKLEGYLYPDTYEFYIGDAPEDVLGKMLRNTESKISDADKQAAAAKGYSVDQILTIASIIQKESASTAAMPSVAGVVYNRLNKPMALEMTATRNYIKWYLEDYVAGDFKDSYNTYNFTGLPVGPICNPGRSAIDAALNPESNSYYFFFSDSAGTYYFSETFEEHTQKMADAGVTVPTQ